MTVKRFSPDFLGTLIDEAAAAQLEVESWRLEA